MVISRDQNTRRRYNLEINNSFLDSVEQEKDTIESLIIVPLKGWNSSNICKEVKKFNKSKFYS